MLRILALEDPAIKYLNTRFNSAVLRMRTTISPGCTKAVLVIPHYLRTAISTPELFRSVSCGRDRSELRPVALV